MAMLDKRTLVGRSEGHGSDGNFRILRMRQTSNGDGWEWGVFYLHNMYVVAVKVPHTCSTTSWWWNQSIHLQKYECLSKLILSPIFGMKILKNI